MFLTYHMQSKMYIPNTVIISSSLKYSLTFQWSHHGVFLHVLTFFSATIVPYYFQSSNVIYVSGHFLGTDSPYCYVKHMCSFSLRAYYVEAHSIYPGIATRVTSVVAPRSFAPHAFIFYSYDISLLLAVTKINLRIEPLSRI